MAITPINTLLEVDRDKFTLKLYKRPLVTPRSYTFRLVKTYPIAVGAVGYKTPRGYYLINSRSNAPEWKMPDSDWVAPELRGTIVPAGDPNNPIKARWLGVTDPKEGIGIHGTADDASIGTRASHGCIRMHVPDIIELYPLVKKFTPVFIV